MVSANQRGQVHCGLHLRRGWEPWSLLGAGEVVRLREAGSSLRRLASTAAVSFTWGVLVRLGEGPARLEGLDVAAQLAEPRAQAP